MKITLETIANATRQLALENKKMSEELDTELPEEIKALFADDMGSLDDDEVINTEEPDDKGDDEPKDEPKKDEKEPKDGDDGEETPAAVDALADLKDVALDDKEELDLGTPDLDDEDTVLDLGPDKKEKEVTESNGSPTYHVEFDETVPADPPYTGFSFTANDEDYAFSQIAAIQDAEAEGFPIMSVERDGEDVTDEFNEWLDKAIADKRDFGPVEVSCDYDEAEEVVDESLLSDALDSIGKGIKGLVKLAGKGVLVLIAGLGGSFLFGLPGLLIAVMIAFGLMGGSNESTREQVEEGLASGIKAKLTNAINALKELKKQSPEEAKKMSELMQKGTPEQQKEIIAKVKAMGEGKSAVAEDGPETMDERHGEFKRNKFKKDKWGDGRRGRPRPEDDDEDEVEYDDEEDEPFYDDDEVELNAVAEGDADNMKDGPAAALKSVGIDDPETAKPEDLEAAKALLGIEVTEDDEDREQAMLGIEVTEDDEDGEGKDKHTYAAYFDTTVPADVFAEGYSITTDQGDEYAVSVLSQVTENEAGDFPLENVTKDGEDWYDEFNEILDKLMSEDRAYFADYDDSDIEWIGMKDDEEEEEEDDDGDDEEYDECNKAKHDAILVNEDEKCKKIKVHVYDIDWDVKKEDIVDLVEGDPDDEDWEEKVQAAIDNELDKLPTSLDIEVEYCPGDDLHEIVSNAISNEVSWLHNDFNFDVVKGEEGIEVYEADDDEWCVVRVGGSVGDKNDCRIGHEACTIVKDGLSADEAKDLAKSYRKLRSPGERGYYRISYKAVPKSAVKCDAVEVAEGDAGENTFIVHARDKDSGKYEHVTIKAKDRDEAIRKFWDDPMYNNPDKRLSVMAVDCKDCAEATGDMVDVATVAEVRNFLKECNTYGKSGTLRRSVRKFERLVKESPVKARSVVRRLDRMFGGKPVAERRFCSEFVKLV